MKNILIINKVQFGYFTDYYKYCQYIKDEYNVTFLCFDSGLPKLEMDGVNVKYVSNRGIRLLRGIRFITRAFLKASAFKGIIFVKYFEKCQLLKQFVPRKKMIVDIRSLSISKNKHARMKYNKDVKMATQHFNFVTIISDDLRTQLHLDREKSAILPLGSDIISETDKNFETDLKLLYVGSLSGRNIEQTVLGLSIFLENNTNITDVSYDIVGDGKEIADLRNLVKKQKLNHIIKIHGRIPHFEIQPFFDNCNFGISYVPVTEYYEYQPVTKTFEYILSGMPCIATRTYENIKVINEKNGVLCDDNPESFAIALEETFRNCKTYRSDEIRKTLGDYTWEKIVKNYLLPILNSNIG